MPHVIQSMCNNHMYCHSAASTGRYNVSHASSSLCHTKNINSHKLGRPHMHPCHPPPQSYVLPHSCLNRPISCLSCFVFFVPYKEDEAHINWAGPMCDHVTTKNTCAALKTKSHCSSSLPSVGLESSVSQEGPDSRHATRVLSIACRGP